MLLMIDNYDSFTYNLYQLLGEVNGCPPVVVRNDVDWSGLALDQFDNVVISPEPGRPERPRDFGVSARAIRESGLPVLGVCLGHQALSIAFGGSVVRATPPMHGKTSLVAHEGTHLFTGLAAQVEVGRYHSLVIPPDDLPSGFVRTAWVVDDGTVMGIRHEQWPVFGVQFHPESVLTPVGHRLLQNFLEAR